jgi:hypothetical protein
VPIGGAWKAQRVNPENGMYTDRPPVLGRPEYGELHQADGMADEGSRAPWRAVSSAPPAPGWVLDPGDTFDIDAPARTPGLVLDRTPITHEYGVEGRIGESATGAGQDRDHARAEGNRARSQDLGAASRMLHNPIKARGVTETRETVAVELEPISGGSRLGILRGRNGLPENNPDGFRNGVRVQRWQNRKIPQSFMRRHNLHPLRVNLAAAPHNSPARPPSEANRYSSPFGLNVLSRTRTAQSPVARRVPRAWDESAVTDGAPMEDPTYAVWGL